MQLAWPIFHGLRTPNEAFFHWNPELLGLGRQIGQTNSVAFGVLFQEAKFVIIIYYYNCSKYEWLFCHRVLEKLVQCIEDMELACWVLLQLSKNDDEKIPHLKWFDFTIIEKQLKRWFDHIVHKLIFKMNTWQMSCRGLEQLVRNWAQKHNAMYWMELSGIRNEF